MTRYLLLDLESFPAIVVLLALGVCALYTLLAGVDAALNALTAQPEAATERQGLRVEGGRR